MVKLKTLVETKGRFCCYCTVYTTLPIEKGKWTNVATREHIVPVSKGGHNGIENLNVACYFCNCLRGNMTLEKFLEHPDFIARKEEVELRRSTIQERKAGKIAAYNRYLSLHKMQSEAKREDAARTIAKKTGECIANIFLRWHLEDRKRLERTKRKAK